MDAAQKLKTHSGLFLFALIALSLSAPAWADDVPQFIVSPTNTVTLQGTAGQDLTISSTLATSQGVQITYTVSVAYSADSGTVQWLRPISGATTPAIIAVNLSGNAGLQPGPHTATITLHATVPATGVTDATITVNYNSATGGGGGNTTLTSSVNPINLAAA